MSPSQTDDYPTRSEAERIYRAIFGDDIPAVVSERFASASKQLEQSASAGELDIYREAIARVGDLEALEVAGRYTGRQTILSRKFRLMVHIAETIPENRTLFVADNDAVLTSWVAITFGAVRTAWKLAKGLALAWRIRGA